MSNTNFIDLNFSPVDILNDLYFISSTATFYLSPSNVYRSDITGSLRDKIQNYINVEIADLGILRSLPKSTYPYHTDEFRLCAINMLMVCPSDTHITKSMVGISPVNVEYRQNYFMMLNVMKLHMTMNKHLTDYRYVLSLGFKNNSYEDMLELHKQGLLLR